jgi:hypothetical protein
MMNTRIQKPTGYRPLLTVENAKTTKGEALGYLTGILYLAPATESGVMNTCQYASHACRAACLFSAGRGRFDSVRKARIAKTVFLHEKRDSFLDSLRYDIARLVRDAAGQGLTPAVRINGTSDLPWIALQMADEFPDVQFYDYTKLPNPHVRLRPNYHLTFSFSGENHTDVLLALQNGINVSVVFSTMKGEELPEAWNGYRVVDGDLHDLRFLDSKGVIVGLRAKGEAKAQTSAFIVIAA